VLHPPPPAWERQRVRNDDSITIELRIGDVSILLPGDIGREGEQVVTPQLALAPIAYRLLGGRIALWLHIGWGVLLITPAMLNYMVTPLALPGLSDPVAGSDYGWPEVAAEISKVHERHPDAFLAATRYTYAAQLGLILHDTGIAAFNPIPSQIDYWFDARAHAGNDALIIADGAFPIANAQSSFAFLTKLEDIPVMRFGQKIWTFELWLGKGFRPAAN